VRNIFISFVLILNITVSQAQTAAKPIKIAQDVYDSLLFNIRSLRIEKEIVTIETDKFGCILSADTKQEKLKKMLLGMLLIPCINDMKEIVKTNSILTIDDSIIKDLEILDYKNDTIQGQLYTAVRLSRFMLEKKCDSAIDLFSQKQKESTREIKQNGEDFNCWVLAWTLDDAKLDRYAKNYYLDVDNLYLKKMNGK